MKEDDPLAFIQFMKFVQKELYKVEPINMTAKQFCERIGIAYHNDILKELVKYGLVSFFKVGRKRFYKTADAQKISDMLHERKIAIEPTDGRYNIKFLSYD